MLPALCAHVEVAGLYLLRSMKERVNDLSPTPAREAFTKQLG